MSYETSHIRRLSVDYVLVALIALTVVFQVGAVSAAQYLETLTPPDTSTQTADLRISGILVALLIVESLLIIGLWRLYKRLGKRWQRLIKWGIVVSLAGVAAPLAYHVYELYGWPRVLANIAIGVCGYAAIKYDVGSHYRWMAFNLIAVAGGILITGLLGVNLSPIVVIPMLVLMLLWDKLAVDFSDLMGDLVDFSSSVSIPNFVLLPTQIRVDLASVREYIQDTDRERPRSIALVIGVGDLFFPALLTASAAIAYADVWPAFGAFIGTLAGTVALKAELDRRDKGVPGLPWLNSGAIGGFVIGMLPVIA